MPVSPPDLQKIAGDVLDRSTINHAITEDSRTYSEKDAREWIIRKSPLEWVIARPIILTNGLRTSGYHVLVSRLIKSTIQERRPGRQRSK